MKNKGRQKDKTETRYMYMNQPYSLLCHSMYMSGIRLKFPTKFCSNWSV